MYFYGAKKGGTSINYNLLSKNFITVYFIKPPEEDIFSI
jgi:hypothetical protein